MTPLAIFIRDGACSIVSGQKPLLPPLLFRVLAGCRPSIPELAKFQWSYIGITWEGLWDTYIRRSGATSDTVWNPGLIEVSGSFPWTSVKPGFHPPCLSSLFKYSTTVLIPWKYTSDITHRQWAHAHVHGGGGGLQTPTTFHNYFFFLVCCNLVTRAGAFSSLSSFRVFPWNEVYGVNKIHSHPIQCFLYAHTWHQVETGISTAKDVTGFTWKMALIIAIHEILVSWERDVLFTLWFASLWLY